MTLEHDFVMVPLADWLDNTGAMAIAVLRRLEDYEHVHIHDYVLSDLWQHVRMSTDDGVRVPLSRWVFTPFACEHVRVLSRVLKACSRRFQEGPEMLYFDIEGMCEAGEHEDVCAFDAASLAHDFDALATLCDRISNDGKSFLLHLGL